MASTCTLEGMSGRHNSALAISSIAWHMERPQHSCPRNTDWRMNYWGYLSFIHAYMWLEGEVTCAFCQLL